MASSIGNYYQTIDQLSAADSPEAMAEEAVIRPTQVDETLSYLPMMLLLFALVISMLAFMRLKSQLSGRVFMGLTALVLAAMALQLSQGGLGRTELSVQADPSLVPRAVRISHVTNAGFVVAWQTGAPVQGVVRVSEAPDGSGGSWVFVDENSRPSHRVVVKGLEGGRTYYFRILSGTQWFDEGGAGVAVRLRE